MNKTKMFISFIILIIIIMGCSKDKIYQNTQSGQDSIKAQSIEAVVVKNDNIKNWFVASPEGLIVRNAPNGKELFIIKYRTCLEQIESKQQENKQIISGVEGYWIKIRFYGEEGWVFDAYLSDDYPNGNDIVDANSIPFVGENPILSKTYLELNKYLDFICSPIKDFPKYRFGWVNKESNATVKEILDFCNTYNLEYRIYSSGFGQGGGRSDIIKTSYFTLDYLRNDDNTDNSNISVFNIQLFPNSKFAYNGFNTYPETENDVVSYLGDPNFRINDWLLYSDETGLINVGVRILNSKVECISIKQYLAD